MFGALARLLSPQQEKHRRYLPWILVATTILFVVVVRLRLREMPLERDEGEYAYAGQLMLQGIPPYKLAYNMKLPGTYAAYACLMAVFGQTPSGIHIGLTLVNVASILLVFLCGRRLLDDVAGAAAAVAFALMALSPSVLGLQAHATHFVVLPALGGIYMLLKASATGQWRGLFASGVLFGIAFVMKQHGALFGAFGLIYLAWARAAVQKEHFAWSKIRARSVPFDRAKYGRELGAFIAGLALPYLLVCLLLWWAGVFPQFFFWTVSYANKYITALPLGNGAELFRNSLMLVTSPNLFFWLLAGLGAVLMWSERRLDKQKFFLSGLLVASGLSISLGFYFRPHYFILLLPVLSLLTGVAVSRGVMVLDRGRSAERFLSVPALGLFLLGVVSTLVLHGEFWLGQSPVKVCRQIYGNALYPEAVRIGAYLKTNSLPQSSIAVIGSEPEIYFYARRHSATGYIYMYPLTEPHDYAVRMQEEMIREIEAARPEWVVYVGVIESWLPGPRSDEKLQNWWRGYREANYNLMRTIEIEGEKRGETEAEPAKAGQVLLLQRKVPG